MSNQLELTFLTAATGKEALAQLPAGALRRLKMNDVAYALSNAPGHVATWSGKGRQPDWVTQWLIKGGTLEQLTTRDIEAAR